MGNVIYIGKSGLLKKEAALDLAKVLLCTNSLETHPDFILVKPEERKISVDMSRKIATFLSYAFAEAKQKVVVILDCHKATIEFQQAILKLLEDNADRASFIITTETPLLPTIHSRCFCRKFHPWKRENMLEWIVAKQLPVNELVLSIADGRPGLYMELLRDEEFTDKVNKFINNIGNAPEKAIVELGALEEGYYDANKEREIIFLEFVENYLSRHLLDEKMLTVEQKLNIMDLCSSERGSMNRGYGKTESFRFYRKLHTVFCGK